MVTAIKIAEQAGLNPKRFRQALRNAQFAWHLPDAPWTMPAGSKEHEDALKVLASLMNDGDRIRRASPLRVSGRDRDEDYVLRICDELLGERSRRQHRFDFLRGDAKAGVRGACLPVDGWYPERNLVIEYRERQHSERVPFFDHRETVSGIDRGAQRVVYDQRRRDVLPLQGITLIELDYSEFAHDRVRRLIRTVDDRAIIAKRLRDFLSAGSDT